MEELIFQYTKELVLIKIWNDIEIIKDSLGYSRTKIKECCEGERDFAYNHIWSYFPISENPRERWKPVKQYSRYFVSNMGNVMNPEGKLLPPVLDNGITYVGIKLGPGEYKKERIDYFVLSNFKEDQPENKIKHKDKNPLNNNLCNLKYSKEKVIHTKKISVIRKNLDDNGLTIFKSVNAAARSADCSWAAIKRACESGKKFKGYYWSYRIKEND